MIEILPESGGNVLAVRAGEKLTDADYKETFIPNLEKVIAQHGKARLLFDCGENFRGWEPKAAWDDAKYGIKHRNDFEKIAVVGAGRWIEWATKLDAHFIGGEVKVFPKDQLKDAMEWIKA